MVTAQDIQEKVFERAGKGYNMAQVDEFLEELSADFTTLAKENTALKAKLKVLVQKVDEYRQTEDSMRLALLSAQKLSSQIETDAREKADTVVADAQAYADRLTRQVSDGMANEEAKLEEAKKATNRFFDHMRSVCQKQIEFYDKLSQMQLVGGEAAAQPEPEPEPQPEPAARAAKPVNMEETVRSIAASAAEAALDEPEPEEPEAPAQEDASDEDEPTRLFPGGHGQRGKKKKRSFDDFSFDDDI